MHTNRCSRNEHMRLLGTQNRKPVIDVTCRAPLVLVAPSRLCSDPPQCFDVAVRNTQILPAKRFRQDDRYIAVIVHAADGQWVEPAVIGISNLRRRSVATEIVDDVGSHCLKPIVDVRRNRVAVSLEKEKAGKKNFCDETMVERGMFVIDSIRIRLLENFRTQFILREIDIFLQFQFRK